METPENLSLENRLENLERIFVLVCTLLIAFFAFVSTRIVFRIPSFERIFSDMLGTTPLPDFTRLVFEFSNSFGGLGFPMLTAVCPAVAIIYLLRNPKKPAAWRCAIFTIVFLMIFIIVIPNALMSPMISIITDLNSSF